MSAFIPNSGLRKPLNMLEGPIFPNIKKDALRFVNANKFWQADIPSALKSTYMYPMFMENIVTLQSRNRNETIYGASSHRDYVNEQVILPLIPPVDLLPLSRTPRRPCPARVNPIAPTQVFQSSNLNEFYGYLTDRIKPGTIVNSQSKPMVPYERLYNL